MGTVFPMQKALPHASARLFVPKSKETDLKVKVTSHDEDGLS